MHGHALNYLDSAATALKPELMIKTVKDFYTSRYGTVHRAVYEIAQNSTTQYSNVRAQVQQFLGAKSPHEIIFTKGTTESINLVAYSFGEAFIHENDEVIISVMEHHANIVPWQLLCRRKKAHLKVIPLLEDGTLNLDEYRKLLSSRTKIVSITHISNVLGIENPIPQIIEEAHRFGAKVFLDGAQSTVHIPINVQVLDCDFFAFSGHKLYGPTGVGVLYGKYELLEAMPPFLSGGDMIATVDFEKTTFQMPPLKFEAGTPMIAEVLGLGAALNYLLKYSYEEIISYEEMLLGYLLEQIAKMPQLKIIGPSKRKIPLISLTCSNIHTLDLATFLNFRGVAVRSGNLCAQPLLNHFGLSSVLRVSLAPYNTPEEITCFFSYLKDVIKVFSCRR